MDIFEKENDTTLKVIKAPAEAEINTYDITFLKTQRETIQAQKDNDNAQRDIELSEVDNMLAQAEKLGIVEKVIEISPVDGLDKTLV